MFERINVELPEEQLFRGAFRYGDNIYAIPFRYSNVLKYNLDEDKVILINGFNELLQEKAYTNSCEQFQNRYIICAIPSYNSYLRFDLKTEKWDKIDLEDENVQISCITSYEDSIYAFDQVNSQVLLIDLYGKIIRRSRMIEYNSANMKAYSNGVAISFTKTGELLLMDRDLEVVSQMKLDFMEF